MTDRRGAKKLFKTHKGWMAAGITAAALFSFQLAGNQTASVQADTNESTEPGVGAPELQQDILYLQKEVDGATNPAVKEHFQTQLDAATAALKKLTDTPTPDNGGTTTTDNGGTTTPDNGGTTTPAKDDTTTPAADDKAAQEKQLSDSKSYLEKEIAGTTDPDQKAKFQSQLADATAALDKLTDTGTPANAVNDTNTPNKSTQASDQAKADADAAAAAEKAKADAATSLKAKEALVQTQAGYKLGLKGFAPTESAMKDPAFAAGYKQGAAERAAAQKSVVDATSKQEDAAKTAAENALKAKDALVEIQAGYKVGAQGLTPTDIAMKDPAFTAGYKQGAADKAARDAAAEKTAAENALKAKDALVEIQAGYKVGVQGFTPTKIAMQDPAFAAGYKQGVADKVAREAADGTAAENALKAKDALVEIQAGYKVGVQGFTPTELAMQDPAFVAGYNQGKADKAARDAAAKTAADNAIKAKDALVNIKAGYDIGKKGYKPTALAMKDSAFAAGYKQGAADRAAELAANAAKAKDALAQIKAGYKDGKDGVKPTADQMANTAYAAGYKQGAADRAAATTIVKVDPTVDPADPKDPKKPADQKSDTDNQPTVKPLSVSTKQAPADATKATTDALPAAGDATTPAITALGVVAVLGALFGLAGDRRKRA